MPWNHRVIKRFIHGLKTFEIHEVHYDDDHKIKAWTKESISPFGNDLEELKESFEMQKRAFEKPVLEIVLIDGEEKLIEASMSEALE